MLVCVINQHGQLLMPTSPRKARLLLKTKKAKIKTHKPFTIQLLYGSSGYKQTFIIQLDAGFKHAGFSLTTDAAELYSGILDIDQNVSKRIQLRANFRKARRRRKWYRKPRFLNRKRKEGWLAPSVAHRVQVHANLIRKIQKFFPVTHLIIEKNIFDIQKLENPNIKGVEYQQGTLMGYQIREYLLKKYNHTCVYCGATGVPLQVEHTTPKSRGGSSRVSNLVMSCKKCNQRKGTQTAAEFGYPEIQALAGKSYRATTQMNIISKRLLKMDFGDIQVSSIPAYEVQYRRIQLGLEKSHVNDAFAMTGKAGQVRSKPCKVKQTRRNNRKIQVNNRRYGIAIRKQRHQISSGDLIEYQVRGEAKPRLFRVFTTSGSKTLKMFDEVLDKWRFPSVSKVRLISYGKGLCFV